MFHGRWAMKQQMKNLLAILWMFPKIGVPQNGWFIMETPIKIHDLGGQPLFLETPICGKPFLSQIRCAK